MCFGNKYLLSCTLGRWSTCYEIEVYALNPHYSLFYVFSLKDRSLFIPQGGTEEKLKKVYIKKLPNRFGCSNFFAQPLIEIQDFRAAFVNLTRNDCFICFFHCIFHVYVINCVRLLAIIIHCSMFSYSHWSFFFTQPFRGFKNQLPTQFLFGAPLRYK